MVFLFPLYGFLFCARLPECIAMEGDASFARAGSPVETVPISSLVQNRNQAVTWVSFLLVRFVNTIPGVYPSGQLKLS